MSTQRGITNSLSLIVLTIQFSLLFFTIFTYPSRIRRKKGLFGTLERERGVKFTMAEVGRRVGVAVDFSPCSKKALKWAIDNLFRKGDHLILILVRPEGEYESGEVQLWEDTGSPFIPFCDFSNPQTMKKYGVMLDAETLELVNIATAENGVVPILKIYWGDPREKICEAVDKIPLSCLVIGNRGLGKIKRVFLGSVSNHVVNNATCPVTVVH